MRVGDGEAIDGLGLYCSESESEIEYIFYYSAEISNS
jgi:hypothetical protein